MRSRRRPFGDALISMGALALLLAVLVSVDDRVRAQVALRVGSTNVRSELKDAGVQLRDLSSVVIDAARDQSIDHGPMVILVLAGCVLVVMMIRT